MAGVVSAKHCSVRNIVRDAANIRLAFPRLLLRCAPECRPRETDLSNESFIAIPST